jgi:tRNA uridine 5-carboxymethylaminomethyl modification enzyme
MMTSRAEYRLLLRQDNADLRLRAKGHDVGLISDEKYEKLLKKEEMINAEVKRLKETTVGANARIQEFMEKCGSSSLKTATSLAELICRPELNYDLIAEIDPDRKELPADVIEQVEITIRYEGYIERQQRQVDKFRKMEKKKIPADINYDDVLSLRLEARHYLKKFKPVNVGQASRISGVNPADISVLLVYLENYNRNN